jgi:hypothetical protein
MRLLRLRKFSNGYYRVVVHLDTTKVEADETPTPRYVWDVIWPPKPVDMTQADYLTQERPKIRADCQQTLAQIEATEGPALPGEGDEL